MYVLYILYVDGSDVYHNIINRKSLFHAQQEVVDEEKQRMCKVFLLDMDIGLMGGGAGL